MARHQNLQRCRVEAELCSAKGFLAVWLRRASGGEKQGPGLGDNFKIGDYCSGLGETVDVEPQEL